VFSTRSADRPNPIGLHRVEIVAIDGTRVRVRNLEALDGTTIVDVKPVLDRVDHGPWLEGELGRERVLNVEAWAEERLRTSRRGAGSTAVG
jgi:tRNA (Thr-GGU) A37 N-methylase